MSRYARASTFLATLILLPVVGFAAFQATETIILRTETPEDLYLAGRRISILAPVEGDVIAAAQEVTIRSPVHQDLIAVGERIEIQAPVGDDVRAAGRSVRLQEAIGGHVVAAGADIELDPQASVADWAWLAGNNVTINGRVGGSVKVAARTFQLAGEVAGDADIRAERVELLPGARIGGKLIVRSATQPRIADDATVADELVIQQPPVQEQRQVRGSYFGALFFGLAMLVTAAVTYLLFPRYAWGAAAAARERPFWALLLGFVLIVTVPVAVIVLLITGLGFLLGLSLLALYLVALLAGAVTGYFWLAALLLRLGRRPQPPSRGWGLGMVLLAGVLVLIVTLIPVIGGPLLLLLILLGLGALGLRLWQQYRGLPTAAERVP